MASVTKLRYNLERLKGKKESAESSVYEATAQLRRLRKRVRWAEKALVIVNEVAKITQKELQIQMSELGTSCVQAVFEEDIELITEFVDRRNKTEADMYFLENGKKRNPLYGGGFGLADIGAFASRTSLWGIRRNNIRNVLVLDEPFRHLKDQSKEMQYRARKLVQDISEKLELQFIIIDHDPSITKEANKTFSIKKIKGVSKVTI